MPFGRFGAGRAQNNMQQKSAPKQRLYHEDLAELIGVKPVDDVSERNQWWELDDDDRDEVERRYIDAVQAVAETALNDHGLTLVERKSPRKHGTYYEVAPQRSWEDAERKIVETINGVGYFHFSSPREFRSSGPYRSAKDSVAQHLHWIKRAPDVYGDQSYQRRVERQMR